MRKGFLRHLDFLVVDCIAIELAALGTYVADILYLKTGMFPYRTWACMLPLLHIFLSVILDAYNSILQRGYLREMGAIIRLEFGIFAMLIFLFYFLNLMPTVPQSIFLVYFAFVLPITLFMRFSHKFYLHYRYVNVKYSRQIVVAATKESATRMIAAITKSLIRNYQFFGLAILDESMIGKQIGTVTVAADRSTIIEYVHKNVVDEVLICVPDDSSMTLKLARELLSMGVTVHIYMEEMYHTLPNRSISNVFGYDVLTTTISPVTFRQSLAKRVMDVVGGVIGCLITILLTIIIGPIIFIKSPGPIFFTQYRVGKRGRLFKLIKFRSMYMDAEERKKELMDQNKIQDGMMFKIDNDPRIIKGIGTFIRKTSLDEFPQFFNVLKGDMSIVGTRPPTVDEYERYSPQHKRRLSMLPGITGLWQISGRSKITDFEEVVRLDTQYIENWSILEDVKIILKTVHKVFHSDDAF